MALYLKEKIIMWTIKFFKGERFLYALNYRWQDERLNALLAAQDTARAEHGADSFAFGSEEQAGKASTLNHKV